MKTILRTWLRRMWVRLVDPDLVRAYYSTFSSLPGQQVLNHLLDNIYFKIYEGLDAQGALIHNARRSVVQEILENIDAGAHPEKYNVNVQITEQENGYGVERSPFNPAP